MNILGCLICFCIYLHEPRRQGELHFALAPDPTNVHLCSIYARWPSGQETEWLIAQDTSDWDSCDHPRKIQLFDFGDLAAHVTKDVWKYESEEPRYALAYEFPSRGELSSKIPKPLLDPCPILDEGDGGNDYGFGTRHRSIPLCLEGALDGLQYNPFRNQQGDQLQVPQGGIDFTEVVHLWNWMDASAPIPSWTLPDIAWHPSTVPWIMAEWWNYEEVEEIFIYTDGSANKSESSAAAVIFLRAGIEWYYGGYLRRQLQGQPCAHRAELHGILLGYHWLNHSLKAHALLHGHVPSVVFAFDATSAGYKAFGQWGGGQYPDLVKSLRSLCYFLEARYGITIDYFHVKGHADDPGNEAANTVAQSKGVHDCYSTWVRFFDQNSPLELHWLWSLWKSEWATFWRDGILHLPDSPTTFPPDMTPDAAQEEPTDNVATISCRIATANVLTLLPGKRKGRDQEHGLQGRARTEATHKAFEEAGYHVVGVQETRLRKEAKIDQEKYFVFSAAATPRGHHGVQLWFSRKLPITAEGETFQRDHFRILAKDERRIIIKVEAPFLRAIFVSAHALTTQASSDNIERWWRYLETLIPPKYSSWPCFIAADANARLGSMPSKSVGDWDPDEQDQSGDVFHDFLLKMRLWLPATFESCHTGLGGTWCHPRTEQWSRGDFICVPSSLTFDKCKSYVEMEVDLSMQREDHRVAAVELEWRTRRFDAHRACASRRAPLALDDLRADFAGPHRAQHVQSLQAAIPHCPWEMDVHSHTGALQHGLQVWLSRSYCRRQKRPQRQHMSAATWDLIQSKREARNLLFDHNNRIARRLLCGCFAMWANHGRGDPVFLIETPEEASMYAQALGSFRSLGRAVTNALRQDDRTFFDDMAAEAGQMDAPGKSNLLWKKIKWAFPKTRSKSQHQPLMMEQLDDQWIPHFAKLEAGSAMTEKELFQKCLSRQNQKSPKGTLTLEDLPTRWDIESAMRRLSNNKASGPDAVPSDLYRSAASAMAAPLHELYVKMTAFEAEPVQCKGGTMFPIYKKGNPQCAGNYRGVMLLSTLSKIFHSWLRTRIMGRLQEVRVDTQIGGFSKQQAVYGSQSLQVLARIAKARNIPMASIFVDVQGAYHFLIRELVMGKVSASDEQQVIDNLEAWQADTRGLKLWLQVPSTMERMGFPSRLISLLREVHCDTWTRLPHIKQLIRTCRGSRPGSPLADAIYAILMADLHVEVYRILEESEVINDGYKALQLEPMALTWADDLAVPALTLSNDLLVDVVKATLARVHSAFERRGLLLNMNKGKTTAVLAFRGSKAPRYRKQYLLGSNPGVSVSVSQHRQIWLHFACSYRHLGMVFIPDGDVTREVRCRIGQARSAMIDLQKVLFSNRSISVRTRLRLFEALIISRLCYGVSAWGHIPPSLYKQVETFIHKGQRRICGFALSNGPQNDMMIGMRQQPTLHQRISYARLSYAIKVWSHGPETLRTLLIAEKDCSPTSWWHHLEEDLEWCYRLCPDRFPVNNLEPETLAKSWKQQAKSWAKVIRAGYRKAVLQESTAAEVRAWHHSIIKVQEAWSHHRGRGRAKRDHF